MKLIKLQNYLTCLLYSLDFFSQNNTNYVTIILSQFTTYNAFIVMIDISANVARTMASQVPKSGDTVCRIRYRVSSGDIAMKCLSHQVSSLCESKFNQYVKPSDHRANGACGWIMQCVMSWQATHQTYTRVRTSQEAYLQRARVTERGNEHAEMPK